MLILVRHGRTAANAQGLLQGRMDLALDEVGESQARAIAAALPTVHHVIASPLKRAIGTAAAFGLTVEIDERWIELDYGIYDGKPQSALDPADWRRWRADPHYTVEGGESLASLLARVSPALEDLAERARTEDIVVVSHVSPIKAAIAWALDVGIEISWRCQLDQASISRVLVGPRGPSLKSFNETFHLQSPGEAPWT